MNHFDIMDWKINETAGRRFLEASPDAPLLRRASDASPVLEACFSNRASGVLLYPGNLTEKFFDLSSGEAGEILQKLRSFQIRVAIVCAPGSVDFSSRFSEIMSEAPDFRVFEDPATAHRWLVS